METAQVWNACMQAHKAARLTHTKWPGRDELQKATKGRFALHSQSVQMIVAAFLATIETIHKLRQRHPQMKMKYPWRFDLTVPFRSHVLDVETARRLRALMKRLDLVYGAIDLRLTPEGEYVFLEINPSGQYLFVELLAQIPLSDRMAEFLGS